MVKSYKSAVDLWLALLLAAVVVFPFFTGVSIGFGLHWLHWHESLGRIAGLFFGCLGLIELALIATFLWPCRYTLESGDLVVRCGAIERRIPYQTIQRIELSYSLRFAPALSVNRVKLVLTGDHVCFVSPRAQRDFVTELRGRLG